jgi:hypothetical protein
VRIKLEIVLEAPDEQMKFVYKGDPRDWPQIVLDQVIKSEDLIEYSIITAWAREVK